MYLKRIRLKNIKGFRELDFDLARDDAGMEYAGWTVFVGDNGSGKSSLLKAVAVGLTGKETARALQPSFARWVADGEAQGTIALDVAPLRTDDEFRQSGKTTHAPFPVMLDVLVNGGGEPSVIDRSKGKTAQRGLWDPAAGGWFCCGYGPFRRVFGASSEAQRQMVAPNTERFVTLFREDASLSEMDRWLRDLNYKKLEGSQDAEAQLGAVLRLLRDEFMPNDFGVDRVDSDGLWLRDRQGVVLSWADMSDGYRAALALLGDVLRHMMAAYGTDGLFAEEDGRIVVARSGVVLIDEIDAHLHPEWQREIGFWLTRHFPKVQFLVTSHSPLICQAASRRGIFHLPEPGSGDLPRRLSDADYTRIVASRPDTILLSPAFGLENSRSPRAVEWERAYSWLKSKRRVVELSPEEQMQLADLEPYINAMDKEEL